MATVYRARDRRLGREVAVKVIHPHLRDSREVVSRFNAEAKAVAKLRHPNIVDVYDVSEPDEADQYLVVGLVRGTTLRKLLQERGAMPPEIGAALGIELLAALAHAHANGVVHRDVKPENVLIERATRLRPKSRTMPRTSGDRVARRRQAHRLRDRQAARRPGRDLDGAGARESRAHGARADRGRRRRRAFRRLRGRGAPLRMHGRPPAVRRQQPGPGSEASPRRAVSRGAARAADRRARRGARSSIAPSLTRRPIDSPTRTRCATPSPRSSSGSRSRRPSAISRRGSTIRRRSSDGHRKKIVDGLCALAGDARKRGDVLARGGGLQPRPRATRRTIRTCCASSRA